VRRSTVTDLQGLASLHVSASEAVKVFRTMIHLADSTATRPDPQPNAGGEVRQRACCSPKMRPEGGIGGGGGTHEVHWCPEIPLHILGLSGAEDVRVRVRCCVLARRKEGRSGRSLEGRVWMDVCLPDKVARSFQCQHHAAKSCRL
jgi:hypothetical protein